MTSNAMQTARWAQIREALHMCAAGLVIVTVPAGGIVWLTGGFRPQTQVEVERLTGAVTDLRTQVVNLTSKVEVLPRGADYAAHDAHLARLDTQVEGLTVRATRDEIAAETTRTRVDELHSTTSAPVRIPR